MEQYCGEHIYTVPDVKDIGIYKICMFRNWSRVTFYSEILRFLAKNLAQVPAWSVTGEYEKKMKQLKKLKYEKDYPFQSARVFHSTVVAQHQTTIDNVPPGSTLPGPGNAARPCRI